MPGLSIVRPGMFTTVQDLGRWGFQSRGVPVSGAMDQYSHRLANRLVGNTDNAATLEATLIGPQIAFSAEAAFAVAGAIFELTLDGRPIEMDRMIAAPAGSILKFGERKSGARAYIGVAGGIDVPEVLGSRSTHVLTRMGGLNGRALRAGDQLPVGQTRSRADIQEKIQRKESGPFHPQGGARLRVIPADADLFEHLESQRFRISPQSDRMGYRLEVLAGSVPFVGRNRPIATGEMISTAVATGVVQVPPTGQPVLLMADHATTGGYAVAGAVITADVPVAAQLAPGDWIEFEPCSLEAGDRALADQEASLGRN